MKALTATWTDRGRFGRLSFDIAVGGMHLIHDRELLLPPSSSGVACGAQHRHLTRANQQKRSERRRKSSRPAQMRSYRRVWARSLGEPSTARRSGRGLSTARRSGREPFAARAAPGRPGAGAAGQVSTAGFACRAASRAHAQAGHTPHQLRMQRSASARPHIRRSPC